ncbi:MAG: U32 family peptidase [Promethearchaeota archaeon]|nr:MAG: U32 family peptidase [Candidatus Lokiarchaeota archaeon]
MKKRPELVAPAQDWNVLKVIEGLADAVYLGVENFNMRKKARNFESKDLKKITDFCHHQNPRQKVYLCTNILIYDSELQKLEDLISRAKNAGIDAIIAHDLAAIKIAKNYNMKFHVSTQANVSNIETAKFYEDFGADRIILARELSLNQIQNIKNELKKAEIECFVHGAMCTSISGRCYFSATINDSEEYSANRGNCVQPCRRQWRVFDDENNEFLYDGQQFLNAKDLCMIEFIPDLINAKIDAFKIEGRMKDPLYVKTVAECYKEALDCFYDGTYTKEKVKNWLKRLAKVYNRGFHTGFYFHRPTLEDIELEKRGNISPFKKTYLGKILAYDKKSKSVNSLIENRELFLKVGDEIIISGNNSYHIEKVKTIIFKGEKVNSIKRDSNGEPIEFNMPLNSEVGIYDKIYIISKDKY